MHVFRGIVSIERDAMRDRGHDMHACWDECLGRRGGGMSKPWLDAGGCAIIS